MTQIPTPIPDLPALCAEAVVSVTQVRDALVHRVRGKCLAGGRVNGHALEARQTLAHGLSWFATYVDVLQRLADWSRDLEARGSLGDLEQLILQVVFGEYLGQLVGGLPMSQGEFVRFHDYGLDPDALAPLEGGAARVLIVNGNSDAARKRLAELIEDRVGVSVFGSDGLSEDLEIVRDQFRRFAGARVAPHAQRWHLEDSLIPLDVIQEMAELGVFGLTIPEEHGGAGMSKTAMCVVSEELSRAYIGVGSLATRTEIASELVLCGGTEAQKTRWLPGLASGAAIPTAVFTEPGTGSDLGSLTTRAERSGDFYLVTGNKTWITHGSRAGMMTLLARTDPSTADHSGLSMFLIEKTPGTPDSPFPDKGISGSEIGVIGYRGMKEYEIAFDRFPVPLGNLLGGQEGQGFRHLMRTFESARIQTAARAVGVAQSALDAALDYAIGRVQFGKPIIRFPRVYAKLAMMAAEIAAARQLTYHAARKKDSGERCDLEAGMAKLLAARVAWSSADNAVQIHGGNGFAEEYAASRILCDARILSIFEGAAEIQAHIIARRILEA